MPRPSQKTPRSLVILLQALVGTRITVELRHYTVVSGLLDSVDARMKLVHDKHFLLRFFGHHDFLTVDETGCPTRGDQL